MTFENKVALVTASGRGIGLESARKMADLGASVIINDIDQGLLDKAEKSIKDTGANVLAINANVTSPDQVHQMVDRAAEKFGGIDILVNNAGGSLATPRYLEETTEEDWAKVLDLCLTSQFRVTKAVLPYMKKKGWGRIVNISSSAGTHGESAIWSPPYSTAKAGVLGFTKQIAIEVGRHGITCNAIAQGDTWTERTQELYDPECTDVPWHETLAEGLARYEKNPIPRFGRPEEIAATIIFLCSEGASYINAETIMITGGAWIAP